jgi:SAM-dependent methyltransferase
MLEHSSRLAGRLIDERGLGAGSLVVEIASNDGYLLQFYRDAGVPVLGIEPARNIARFAQEEKGIRTECAFFDDRIAREIADRGERADVLHAHNVLAHVADLHGVVQGMYTILNQDGIAVIEVPYLLDMIDKCEFDTIYHEHLCYFSLTSLTRLFAEHRLAVGHVEHVTIHGGSLRLYVGREDASEPRGEAVEKMLRAEEEWGVAETLVCETFAGRVKEVQENLVGLLREYKAEGRSVAAYGASAKGCVLLNSCGIGRETIDFIVDRSTEKQGSFAPGTHLPIYPPERLLEEMPDLVLLLTWNFAEEILRQQEAYRAGGGKFVVPIPRLEVV